MEAFALLLDRLYYTHSNLEKAALLKEYFTNAADPDRGWAMAALAGTLSFDLFKRHTIKEVVETRVDPVLFDLSRDYVGEMSETVAHIWPVSENSVRLNRIPPLHEVIERFSASDKQEIREYLTLLLDNMTSEQRWALLKLGTSGLRVGVSARFMKNVLAQYGHVPVEEIEGIWHGVSPPYTDLFQWLEGKGPKPDIRDSLTFHPVMLSHPISDSELESITPDHYTAEWKYDGIRVQLVCGPKGKALYSRTGDDISLSFPDLLWDMHFNAVLDGELLVKKNGVIAPFNDLQQRLNKKAPGKKLMDEHPAHVMLYDILEADGVDLRAFSFLERREKLREWLGLHPSARMEMSGLLAFASLDALKAHRALADRAGENYIEGLMLKRKTSPYIPGRPKGHWYKWKRDPLMVDAVLMYAQRGSGKRSSYYSDYTFGLWSGAELLPIGKAYSGFTDEELKKLDSWIRNHTTHRFGPVREVERGIVFEVAFDSVHPSPRHKSGYALRFPRINRIRWDKPFSEADQLARLANLIQANSQSEA
jgi:DNA ligase-1